MIAVQVNGVAQSLVEGATLADAVATLTTAHQGVAVAVDDTVVPRSQWPTTTLAGGARIEVVTAVQGG